MIYCMIPNISIAIFPANIGGESNNFRGTSGDLALFSTRMNNISEMLQ